MAKSAHDTVMIDMARAAHEVHLGKDSLRRQRLPGARNMNHEDAIQHYHQAYISYSICKEWEEAADCIEQAADLLWRMGDKHEGMMVLGLGAELRERVNPFDSVTVYDRLISMACSMSRYREAGQYQQRVAELHEEARNYEDAMEAYRGAAQFYNAEMMGQEAHGCLVRYARICADLEVYDTALSALLDLAEHCLSDNLTKFNARDFLFKAGMTYLAQGDTAGLQDKLRHDWPKLDRGLRTSKEGLFLQSMIDVRRPIDMDRFADDIYDYDKVGKMDSWCIRMLKRYKVFLDDGVAEEARRTEAQRRAEDEAIAERKAEAKTIDLLEPEQEAEADQDEVEDAAESNSESDDDTEDPVDEEAADEGEDGGRVGVGLEADEGERIEKADQPPKNQA